MGPHQIKAPEAGLRWIVIHPHALWLCAAAVFLAGLSVGFALGVLVVT